ncbi:MAG: hypothetical protein BJ554DRAFT_4779 [Olpidium bornovanus]|uniref:Uncharacterized protein n=1 Tax=Olpidium bornovanus TaxID=278681 RepID=A0A8H7ZLR4_9FUNG|nr:MAG: hypothetical protein BJ554DRAFT_4779 [Olpidium bornovanus]
MLAIFYSILEEPVESTVDVQMQVGAVPKTSGSTWTGTCSILYDRRQEPYPRERHYAVPTWQADLPDLRHRSRLRKYRVRRVRDERRPRCSGRPKNQDVTPGKESTRDGGPPHRLEVAPFVLQPLEAVRHRFPHFPAAQDDPYESRIYVPSQVRGTPEVQRPAELRAAVARRWREVRQVAVSRTGEAHEVEDAGEKGGVGIRERSTDGISGQGRVTIGQSAQEGARLRTSVWRETTSSKRRHAGTKVFAAHVHGDDVAVLRRQLRCSKRRRPPPPPSTGPCCASVEAAVPGHNKKRRPGERFL